MSCSSTVDFSKFLDDLCTKNKVECPPPKTSARMLDKVRQRLGVLVCATAEKGERGHVPSSGP